ncbi:hypothetical protein S83_032706, partial [Arachis hypogaea]
MLNQKFSLNHSVSMGPTEIPSQSMETIKTPTANYEFGATFIDHPKMLLGRILTDGRLNARVKCDVSENLTLKANAQTLGHLAQNREAARKSHLRKKDSFSSPDRRNSSEDVIFGNACGCESTEEGILRLLFAVVFLIVNKNGNDSETSATSGFVVPSPLVQCDKEPAPWTSDEHGDRPRPLLVVKELKGAIDVTERKKDATWDYNLSGVVQKYEEKEFLIWKRPTTKQENGCYKVLLFVFWLTDVYISQELNVVWWFDFSGDNRKLQMI